MRIGIGSKSLLSPLTGIGQYVWHLSEELEAAGQSEVRYFCGLFWAERRNEFVQCGGRGGKIKGIRNQLVDAIRKPIRSTIPRSYEMARLVEQRVFARGALKTGIDLYHEPNFVPYEFDGPTVINIHDLSLLRYPETQPKERVRAVGRRLPYAVSRADKIITASEYVRGEILDIFDVGPEKVSVIPNGVSNVYRPREGLEIQDVLRKYQLACGNYIITVGTLEPRKNLRGLLRAYSAMSVAAREMYPLVIVGMKGWGDDDIEMYVQDLVEKGQVRFLGYVDCDDIRSLYAGATLLAYPSLYEGFGFPPLEAMASGVPVLASNRSSIPEVVGDAGLLVEPEDDEAMAWALRELLEDEDQRRELVDRGLERARGFTWERTARMTLEVYKQVLGKN